MQDASKTAGYVLKAGTEYLETHHVDQSRIICELLLSRLLNCKRLELPLKFDTILNDKLLDAMRRGTKRVASGEPVQYVLGQTGFMGHTFKVDRRALIPRPETEVLVEQVLKYEPVWKIQPKPVIADIGTGSGCIVISLAIAKPNALYVGLDVSNDAIELAKENAALLGVQDKISFNSADLSDIVEPETLDAFISNPPYVSMSEYEKLPVHIRDHEPRIALDGGPAGLSIIENLIQDAVIVLKSGGALFMEIGDRQASAVTNLLKETGFDQIKVIKDLAGKDRIISAIKQ